VAEEPRPTVHGKSLFVGDERLYVRGVTYGTFRPDADGHEFPSPEVVTRDFDLMSARGVNALRTYTAPPRWLLDEAHRHGLRVMVGLAAERYVGHLNDRRGGQRIAAVVRDGVAACAEHPAVLCFALANEIPATIVRWFGRRRIERLILQLSQVARQEDPHGLLTYVNYPSTEYLQLPFLDLCTYNVYLESSERLKAYLARLQNIAGDRPLVMGELGLDSVRNGEGTQAASVSTQVRTAFAAGCAGAFVYAWTDEWHRGGEDVEDWAFGLTRRDRSPKLALAAAERAFEAVPFPRDLPWPRVSVVVCSYNGARTLRDCLDGLLALDYPNYEVVVIDDGSTDGTAAIASEYPFRLIKTPNRGLSAARNTGLEAATGEIVAYLDDDARPDAYWLRYLTATFMDGDWAGVGGPNLTPPGDGAVADCVGNAPGGPVHVLLSDREAEHIPGCNMAFRRSALEEVGGFDPRFRVAGDDVDACWRLRARNHKLGFSPAAVVWHHRRGSVRAYLRQQRAYGEAESILVRKWPEKYNAAGHMLWGGRLYGGGVLRNPIGARRSRVHYGSQGSGLFQSLYEPASPGIVAFALMPEWYLLVAWLGVVALLARTWNLLFATIALLAVAVAPVVVAAVSGARAARFPTTPGSTRTELARRMLTLTLHLLQPAARLYGRLAHGLTPWRRTAAVPQRLSIRRTWAFWSEAWNEPAARLKTLERRLAAAGAGIVRGGDFDRWDLEIRVGVALRARLQMAVEEHAARAQLIRLRAAFRPSAATLAISALLVVLAGAGLVAQPHLGAGLVLAGSICACLGCVVIEWAALTGAIAEAIERLDEQSVPIGSERRSAVSTVTLTASDSGS
jgi:glycosyltransferase involved in cell wall biosynthesis